MKLLTSLTTVLLLTAGSAAAEDAVVFQCQVAAQGAGPSQTEPFTIEIRGSAVKLSGVESLDGSFGMIRKNDAFYVFKNAKGQGGNINRADGVAELYAVNAASHKMTVSITARCSRAE